MREPRFWAADLDPWSREAAPLFRLLMSPFSALYGAVTAHKIASATPVRIDIPVICVGNLTAGGVGKSPVVAALRERLSARTGKRIASLSRGYGGREKGPLKVDFTHHSASDVGDEPLMLSASGESWIGADRAAAGQAMAADKVDAIIMDDGHQNPSLHKDLSLVVVDSHAKFGNGHVIPKGPLREPIAKGLARADAVILMGDGPIPEALEGFDKPILRATIIPRGPAPTGPLVAFAGIGRPEKLFDSLTGSGGDLKDAIPFPDHHVYSSRDLQYLQRLAEDHQAKLITTEKDYVRLNPQDRSDILTFPVEAKFEDEHMLDSLLDPLFKTS
ncbi:tetraacyldisaccharide 4'-kinase [Hyphomonas sp. FCG-A18]|uniref:tetraacyldisaccharide 4'-kinase n=1 Tax=Hyphomonas sp. FCG-A18 TaxID=3080019 RepID=UPI002B2D07F4|nr:tetraacyldisaccharide 4'-kinase [Hyphomonas sp. FCG-A18]